MTDIPRSEPQAWPARFSPDDSVLPFQVAELGVRGRVVRLGPMVTDILARHDYPEPVASLLAEALALTAMLGASLKFSGKFTLQTSTDGPVDMLVVDYETPGKMRAYAHFDADGLAALQNGPQPAQSVLLGSGHLALTIDQGADMDRYQGIVPIEDTGLAEAADVYFRQSEQIPTNIRLASARIYAGGEPGSKWRSGGILVQHLPDDGVPSPMPIDSGDVPEGVEFEHAVEDDRWTRARLLTGTVEDHELLDPTLSSERLLFRLFHEDGVTAFSPTPLARHCTCSRDRVQTLLRQFSGDDISSMVEDGLIRVTCEFCSARYDFDPEDIVG